MLAPIGEVHAIMRERKKGRSIDRAIAHKRLHQGTTAGIVINENADPSVSRDILDRLEALVPTKGNYHHLEGNAPAHIKSTLTGLSLTVPIDKGRLALGRWQGVFLCEFDGPRDRTVVVQVLPSQAAGPGQPSEGRGGQP